MGPTYPLCSLVYMGPTYPLEFLVLTSMFAFHARNIGWGWGATGRYAIPDKRKKRRERREYHFGSKTISNWGWGEDVMGSQLLEKVKGTMIKSFKQEPTTPAGSGRW